MVGMTASHINSYFIYSFHLSFQDPESPHISLQVKLCTRIVTVTSVGITYMKKFKHENRVFMGQKPKAVDS